MLSKEIIYGHSYKKQYISHKEFHCFGNNASETNWFRKRTLVFKIGAIFVGNQTSGQCADLNDF